MTEREPSRESMEEAREVCFYKHAQFEYRSIARRLDALKAEVAKAQAERDEAVGLLRQLRHCGMLPAKPYYRSDIDMLIQIDTFLALAQHGGGEERATIGDVLGAFEAMGGGDGEG